MFNLTISKLHGGDLYASFNAICQGSFLYVLTDQQINQLPMAKSNT